MTSFKSVLTLATVLALSVSVVSGAFAEGEKACDKGKHHNKHEKMKKVWAEKLNLSEEQQAQMEAVHEEFRAEHKAEFDAMKAKWQEYKDMKANGASEEDLAAKKASIKAEFAGMKEDKKALKEKMKAILTPEQQAKAEEMKAEWKKKHGEKRHKRGHHMDKSTK